MSDLPAGLYLVQLISTNGTLAWKNCISTDQSQIRTNFAGTLLFLAGMPAVTPLLIFTPSMMPPLMSYHMADCRHQKYRKIIS